MQVLKVREGIAPVHDGRLKWGEAQNINSEQEFDLQLEARRIPNPEGQEEDKRKTRAG